MFGAYLSRWIHTVVHQDLSIHKTVILQLLLYQKGELGLILKLKCCTFSVTGWISVKYKINDEITEINERGKTVVNSGENGTFCTW